MKKHTYPLFVITAISCNNEYNYHSFDFPNDVFFSPTEQCEPVELPNPEDMKPIAICDVTTANLAPIKESTTLFGEESYDPNGYKIVEYQWSLVDKPVGSAVGVNRFGTPNRENFTPDLAGEYTFQLSVTNDRCVQSDPCQLTINALPNEDLWIEMHWQHPGDDMDLHLIKNSAGFETDGDCHYGNCITYDDIEDEEEYGYSTLEWGDPLLEADNPRLDLDDIDGTGPENINVDEPAPATYTVFVHDYPDSVLHKENEVTVRVHLFGEVVYEETKTISGEDEYVPFVDIDWPNGTITPR